jgi:site-specific recombinase XerD
MTDPIPSLPLGREEAQRYLAEHLRTYEGRASKTLLHHRQRILRFLTFLEQCPEGGAGHIAFDTDAVLRWMAQEAQGVKAETAAMKYRTVRSFLQALHAAGRIPEDPTDLLRVRLGRRGWTGAARALQAADPEAALASLRPEPRFQSPIGQHLRRHLDLKRSVGMACCTREAVYAAFERFLGSRGVDTPDAVRDEDVRLWLAQMTCCPQRRMQSLRYVGRFFEHLLSLGVVGKNPVDPLLLERRGPTSSFRPYIYAREEVAALLDQAGRLAAHRQFPSRPQVCRTLLALLYGLGLRVGEACRLCLRDVDLAESVVTIRDTKFHKSRLLPFGPRLRSCLERYGDVRTQASSAPRPEDPFFVTQFGRRLSQATFNTTFHLVLAAAGIAPPPGGRRPRPHDLRHSFAVHRLLRWYREGRDVQSLLPRLSTFLGHANITSTQVYLTITHELLDSANSRFWKHFGSALRDGSPQGGLR